MTSARPFARLVILVATLAIVASARRRHRRRHEPEALLLGSGPVAAGHGRLGRRTTSSTTAATSVTARSASRRSPPSTSSTGARSGRPASRRPDSDGKLYSSATLQNYVNAFFASVGGSPWAGVQTQYCRNVPPGTTSCAGVPGADYITNPTHQLKGVWTDPTPVPADIVTLGLAENLVDDPIATEAMRASAHFGYNPNATYIILTPPGTIGTGQPVYCGYHTQTTSVDGSATRTASSTRSSRS